MAFRETVKSLRIYLVVAGALSGLRGVQLVGAADGDIAVTGIGAAGVAVALGFVYAGLRLPTLLARSPHVVRGVIYAFLAFDVAVAAILAVAGVSDTSAWFRVVVGAVIALYLLANVKRLSSEAQAKPDPDAFS